MPPKWVLYTASGVIGTLVAFAFAMLSDDMLYEPIFLAVIVVYLATVTAAGFVTMSFMLHIALLFGPLLIAYVIEVATDYDDSDPSVGTALFVIVIALALVLGKGAGMVRHEIFEQQK